MRKESERPSDTESSSREDGPKNEPGERSPAAKPLKWVACAFGIVLGCALDAYLILVGLDRLTSHGDVAKFRSLFLLMLGAVAFVLFLLWALTSAGTPRDGRGGGRERIWRNIAAALRTFLG